MAGVEERLSIYTAILAWMYIHVKQGRSIRIINSGSHRTGLVEHQTRADLYSKTTFFASRKFSPDEY